MNAIQQEQHRRALPSLMMLLSALCFAPVPLLIHKGSVDTAWWLFTGVWLTSYCLFQALARWLFPLVRQQLASHQEERQSSSDPPPHDLRPIYYKM